MLTKRGLLEWLASFKDSPQVFVVHGEEETSLQFSEMIKEKYGFVTHVPYKGRSMKYSWLPKVQKCHSP